MFEILAVPALNRLLRANPWALEKLREHAGKTVRVESPPAALVLTVTSAGEVAPAASGAMPDTTIALTPGAMLRLAARDEAAWSAVHVTGDVPLASAIDYVRRHLVWDYEEDLSRVFGDVAARRMAQGFRHLDAFGRRTALDLAHAFAEYATHEQPTLALPRGVAEFNREVDEVRDHAARLEKRIELLRRKLEQREP